MSKEELLKLFNNIGEDSEKKKTSASKTKEKAAPSKTVKKATPKKTSKK